MEKDNIDKKSNDSNPEKILIFFHCKRNNELNFKRFISSEKIEHDKFFTVVKNYRYYLLFQKN